MSNGYADLHIHSCYSDGTMTPWEIVSEAKARGVGMIAVADHNVLEGSRQAVEIGKAEGIACLPAVELDCLDGGTNFHVLAYGIDLDDPAFIGFVKRNRALLEEVSVRLIEKMGKRVEGVSLQDYHDFAYDIRLGGWKALHYFAAKGLTNSLKEGLRYYAEYQCPQSIVDFPGIAEACREVHTAGGVAVLAHPGELIPFTDAVSFDSELKRLVSMGLDGVECYYPTHSEEITRICVLCCDELGLLKTMGSDCHGGFGRTVVGEMNVPIEKLRLP